MYAVSVSNKIVQNLIDNAKKTTQVRNISPSYCGSKFQKKCSEAIRQCQPHIFENKYKKLTNFDEQKLLQIIPRDNFANQSMYTIKSNYKHKQEYPNSSSSQNKQSFNKISLFSIRNKGKFIDTFNAQQRLGLRKQKSNKLESNLIKLTFQTQNNEQFLQETRETILKRYDTKRSEMLQALLLTARQQQKKRALKNHLNKGQQYSYTFDNDGQILLTVNTDPAPINHIKPKISIQIKEKELNKVASRAQNSTPIEQKNNVKLTDQSQIDMSMINMKSSAKKLKSSSSKPLSLIYSQSIGQIKQSKDSNLTKRRKLYSNNESRQTTSTPLLKSMKGVQYCQLGTFNRYKNQYSLCLSHRKRFMKQSGFKSHLAHKITNSTQKSIFFSPKSTKIRENMKSEVSPNIKKLSFMQNFQSKSKTTPDQINMNQTLVKALLQDFEHQ